MKDKKGLSREEKAARESFDKMTRNEKVDYIWEYYKLHIIGAVIVVFMLGGFINSRFINPPDEIVFNGLIIGDYVSDESLEGFNTMLKEAVTDIEEGETVYGGSFVTGEQAGTSDYTSQMALTAKIMAKEIDILVMNEEDFMSAANQSVLLKLDEYVENGVLNIDQDMLTEGVDIDETTGIFGVKTNMKILTKTDVDREVFVGVVVNSENIDRGIGVLNYLNQ